LKHLLKKWEKFLEYPSMLPNLKVYKFETDSLGGFKLKFSNYGKYLAAACTMESSKTIIKIFDVELGELRIVLRGHHDLIHELNWSANDNFLISASADGSVKVWNLTEKEEEYGDRLNYTENDEKYFCTSLLHPSYVYGAAFYPDFSYEKDSRLIIGSACFDQRIRVWMVYVGADGFAVDQHCLLELNITEKPAHQFVKGSIYTRDELDDETLERFLRPDKQGMSQGQTIGFDHVHPNCLVFNDLGRLFVGESSGIISIWDVSIRHGKVYAENYFKIRQKELEGDEINQITVHPEE